MFQWLASEHVETKLSNPNVRIYKIKTDNLCVISTFRMGNI